LGALLFIGENWLKSVERPAKDTIIKRLRFFFKTFFFLLFRSGLNLKKLLPENIFFV
jgi:hypothetical protein